MVAAVCACTAPEEDGIVRPVVDAQTVVSLTFDDTFADNLQVGDIAAAHGMRAVFYVNSSRIGRTGYMTAAQLRALEQSGHEIAGHTLTHANLPTLTTAQARAEICDDRAALLDAGFRVTSFAYPFGADNAAVQQIVADCGYNSARDVGGLRSLGACPACPWVNPVPPTNLYAIRTDDSIDETSTLQMMQQYVIDAENNGGGYLPLVFHHVCDGCSANSVSPALLTSFLDWLEARAPMTQVATVDQEIGGSVKPRVSTSDGLPPNLFHNPSLELGSTFPDCWQRGQYGTNTAAYALATDAFDGTRAMNITVSSYTSGGARLVSKQDTGSCAPAVIPGHRYTITAAYKASINPRITVYYRNTSGKWVWLGETALLPGSSSYVDATYTTIAMPTDATAISGGLGIFGVGSLTMDAYRLVDLDAAPPGDTAPPSMSILCNGTACSPASYSGTALVSLTAWDFSGIQQVLYTTDGSDPTVSGSVYTGAFAISRTSTIRAIAVDGAGNTSALSRTITIGPANLLVNASLETDADGNGVPDCWQRGQYGTNTATFALTSDAYDGTRAQAITITSLSSGGRRLVSAQDGGACAPAVTPGRRYTVSAYYTASVPPRFSIYYRNASGTWTWFAESPMLPTASSYTPAVFTTPAMPADATAISVGLTIFSVGSLTSDAYTLVEAP